MTCHAKFGPTYRIGQAIVVFFLTFCPLSWRYWSWVWNSAFPGLYYSNIKTIWKKYIMIFFYAISPGPGWQWSTYILTFSLQTVRHWERGDSERHPSVEERLEPLLCFCFQTNQKKTWEWSEREYEWLQGLRCTQRLTSRRICCHASVGLFCIWTVCGCLHKSKLEVWCVRLEHRHRQEVCGSTCWNVPPEEEEEQGPEIKGFDYLCHVVYAQTNKASRRVCCLQICCTWRQKLCPVTDHIIENRHCGLKPVLTSQSQA